MFHRRLQQRNTVSQGGNTTCQGDNSDIQFCFEPKAKKVIKRFITTQSRYNVRTAQTSSRK